MKILFEADNQNALRKHECEISILLCFSKGTIQHLRYICVVLSVAFCNNDISKLFNSTVKVSGEYLHSHIRDEKKLYYDKQGLCYHQYIKHLNLSGLVFFIGI